MTNASEQGASGSKQGVSDRITARLEAEVRPLLEQDTWDGGYNCCGCSTYSAILDHALRIVREERA